MRRSLALVLVPLLAACPQKQEDPCTPTNQKTTAQALLRSYYLYAPDYLATVSPTDGRYPTLQDYLDASTAPARAQGWDRGWTYTTSLTSTQAHYVEGTSVGFGIGTLVRQDQALAFHLFVTQVFPGSAAADASFARGDEIVGIDDGTGMKTVAEITAGAATIDAAGASLAQALGPPTAGLTYTLSVLPAGSAQGTTPVDRTMTKRTYGLDPVPLPNGNPVVLDAGGGLKVGYVALRTFIPPAEATLASVFSQFQTAGVQDVIVDLRYNGGGTISTADVLANLLGGAQAQGSVEFRIEYNAQLSSSNQTVTFNPPSQAVKPTRIAFITTGATASASELVPNVMEGWMGPDVALVGAKTYGKPVGQMPFQLIGCDAVVNVVALRLVNVQGDGGYYGGLPDQPTDGSAPKFSGPLCQAADDLTHDQWDPAESSTAAALQWLATGTCPPPPAAAKPSGATALKAGGVPALDAYPEPAAPDESQRNVRGLF